MVTVGKDVRITIQGIGRYIPVVEDYFQNEIHHQYPKIPQGEKKLGIEFEA